MHVLKEKYFLKIDHSDIRLHVRVIIFVSAATD